MCPENRTGAFYTTCTLSICTKLKMIKNHNNDEKKLQELYKNRGDDNNGCKKIMLVQTFIW